MHPPARPLKARAPQGAGGSNPSASAALTCENGIQRPPSVRGAWPLVSFLASLCTVTGDLAPGEPTVLKSLLRARHWQKHATFAREWDRVARQIDPKLVGTWPRHAQFYRWLRGDLRELPYPDACRILEALFPEHTVKDLFQPCTAEYVSRSLPNAADEAARVPAEGDPVEPFAGLSNAWPRTNPDVLDDLVARVTRAQREISVFGLTRNFYAKDEMLPLFEERASQIPVTFYVMDPRCDVTIQVPSR